MTNGIPHGTVSTHAEAGDGTLATVGDSIEVLVRIFNEFLRDESLVTAFRYYRAVPIPAVTVSIGTNKDDSVSVGYLWKVGTNLYPSLGMTTMSVKEIDDWTFFAFHGLIRTNGYYLDVLVHTFATYHEGIYLGGLQTKACQKENA